MSTKNTKAKKIDVKIKPSTLTAKEASDLARAGKQKHKLSTKSRAKLTDASRTHKPSQKPAKVLMRGAKQPRTSRRKIAAPVRTVELTRAEKAAAITPKHSAVDRHGATVVTRVRQQPIKPSSDKPSPAPSHLQQQIYDFFSNEKHASPPPPPIDSHSELKSTGRWFTLKRAGAFGLLIAIFVAGFSLLSSRQNIYFSLAASSAGIEAHEPSFVPLGYVLSSEIEASPGSVKATYASDLGDRKYHVAQTRTTWDSRALFDNYVNVIYQGENDALLKNGLTLYLYDNGSISWINRGIWYEVTSSGDLSTQQLIDIALSL